MSKKPTPTQVNKWLGEVKEERDGLKQELADASEKLLVAQRRICEMEQEKTSRDVQDSIKALLLFLLSAALVWVARLEDWRATLGLKAFCPSCSAPPNTLWKFQAWLCDLLQPHGGELKLFALIIWPLTMVMVFLSHKLDSLLVIAGPAISLCVFLGIGKLMAVIVLFLGYLCFLMFSQTKSADEVASNESVVHRA